VNTTIHNLDLLLIVDVQTCCICLQLSLLYCYFLIPQGTPGYIKVS